MQGTSANPLIRTHRRVEAIYRASRALDHAHTLPEAAGLVLDIVGEAISPARFVLWSSATEVLTAFPVGSSPGDRHREVAARVFTTGDRTTLDSVSGIPIGPDGEIVYVLSGEWETEDVENGRFVEEVARMLSRHEERWATERALLLARDRAEEAARLKSAFLATMSHEVRTPLNAVIGLMDLLRTRSLDAESLEYVTLAQAAGKDLLRIVSDILDFSKLEAGALEVESIDFDLFGLVSRIVAQHAPNAAAKRLFLHSEVAGDVVPWIRSDPVRIGQVLGNLVANAIKFTDQGSVVVHVGRKGDFLHFEVTDSGVGIPDAARALLFQPFRQADESTTRRFGGTGLGLAIARSVVEKLGGTIDYRSNAGKGTTFWFEVPHIEGREELPQAEVDVSRSLSRAPQPADARRRRVLVAEDNPVNQRLIQGLLSHLGYDATVVGDGASAVRKAAEGGYAVLLIDWQMPILDGLSAITQIRAEEATRTAQRGAGRVPILAVTAHALPGDREKCVAAGADDYLTKPIRADALAETLQRWVRGDVTERFGFASIDHEVLDELRGLGIDFFRELVGIFITDAPMRIERMRNALGSGDGRELAQQAHALKGSAGNLAATRVQQLAGDIEARARAGELDTVSRLLEEVQREFTAVRLFLEDTVAESESA